MDENNQIRNIRRVYLIVGGVLALIGFIFLFQGLTTEPGWGNGQSDTNRLLSYIEDSIRPLIGGSAILMTGAICLLAAHLLDSR